MKIESARFLRSAVDPRGFIVDQKPQIAFAGRSNVGKSSLLNRLLGRRKLARTSSTPGRTRAINYFLVNDRFYFVDLPGYGYAKVSKRERREWGELVTAYLEDAAGRARIVQLVDAKVGATPLDAQAFEYFEATGVAPAVVATKADRVSRGRRHAMLAAVRRELGAADAELYAVSAKTGDGLRDLWSSIDRFLGSFDRTTDADTTREDDADAGVDRTTN